MKFWAHPRSRGEHLDERKYGKFSKGSSPLARGTHLRAPFGLGCKGLIPARAGNTDFTSDTGSRAGAHPRSRGEHQPFNALSYSESGSSPLARGTLLLAGAGAGGLGLIPARAGNTSLAPWRTFCTGAHPRSRGEHGEFMSEKNLHLGSSPLARGTPGTRVPIR